MKREKLTRKDLREMRENETRFFELPDAMACDCGKSVAYQMQHILGCKFSVSTDYANCRLAITKKSAV